MPGQPAEGHQQCTCGKLSHFVNLRSLTVVHPKTDGDGAKLLDLRIRKGLEQLATWKNLTGTCLFWCGVWAIRLLSFSITVPKWIADKGPGNHHRRAGSETERGDGHHT
jgi:hypothetical protein